MNLEQPQIDPAPRPTHPLKAWRETQRVWDDKRKINRPMKISDAARSLAIPYQTWMAWERYRGEPGHRMPSPENQQSIFKMTRGQVRPDHFHNLPELLGDFARAGDEAA